MSPNYGFGFASVSRQQRQQAIAQVFASAARHYDLLNDVMSLGLHRLWKRRLVAQAAPRPEETWLDLACGSGDVTALLAAPNQAGRVMAADPSTEMLMVARQRLGACGRVEFSRCVAESLPFAAQMCDGIACAFGLRNFTEPVAALREMRRVLKPGGRLLIMEFAQPWQGLAGAHRRYLLEALPALGSAIANDAASYRYLGESILVQPGQEETASMLRAAGFAEVSWVDLAAGVTAIYSGWNLL